jgi:carbamoyltransferase
MIKNREHYRPFAPSVLEERLGELVDLPCTEADYSFMTYVLPVKSSAREMLGAVTHVDGTARLQSVSRDIDDLYWSLIRHFERITGVPALLNTSLNNHAEPIVNSIDDAISLLLTSPLDLLVVGEHVITRRHSVGATSVGAMLCPALPPSRKLVRRMQPDGGTGFAVEATASSHFAPGWGPISAPAYAVLAAADGEIPAAGICNGLGLTEAEGGAVAEELHVLWGERAISMRPPR